MKRTFKETVNYFKKADMLCLERRENSRGVDVVIMLNGSCIVEVPYSSYYVTEFMTASPRFRAVEKGKFYRTRDAKGIPEEIPSGYTLDDLLSTEDCKSYAMDTGLIKEKLDDWQGPIYMHIYLDVEKQHAIYVNQKFTTMIREMQTMVGNVDPQCGTEKTPLKILNPELGFEGVWLPINYTREPSLFRDIAEAIEEK